MASVRLFEHVDFAGRNVLVDNPGHQRYLLATDGFLKGLHFNDVTSSLQMRSATTSIPSTVLLFQHKRFSGRLKAFAYNGNRDVGSLPDFNDLTSSVLLMDHDPNPNTTLLPIRELAGGRLNDAIDTNLADVHHASRSGDVLVKFTIDLFEVSLFGVDLMLVEIPVKIHTSLSAYKAKIRYWIKLFIDGSHRVRGYVAAWGYWIEGGLLTGSIEHQLRPQVESNIGNLETQLNAMLVELDFHQWTDVYLMPGRASVTADYNGRLDDDCTVVLLFTP